MNTPKISIITICFNSASTIRSTIESVLSQHYPNLEYIIVDGASTDNTISVVNEYRDRITKIISERDKGISDAFNKGISVSTGDLIGIINSDDILLSGSLQEVAKAFDGIHDIYQFNIILENSLSGFRCREVPSYHFSTFPIFCHIAHQGMFVTPECYRKIGGYDIDIRYPMDLDFVIRASKENVRFKYTNTDVAVFKSGGVTSTSIFKKKKDYIYTIKKNSGSLIQAYLFFCFLVGIQIVKKSLNLFGADRIQSLRYKSIK